MGIQNQLKKSGTAAHTISNQVVNTLVNSILNLWNRARASSNTFVKPTICPNCGYGCSASDRQNFSERRKNCKNCGIANHFAKVCRKTKVQKEPKATVNTVGNTSSETATIDTSVTAGEQINQIETMLQRYK